LAQASACSGPPLLLPVRCGGPSWQLPETNFSAPSQARTYVMVGFQFDNGYKVPAEQRALLARRNYTLRPLGSIGALGPLKVLEVAWQPIAIFMLSLLVQAKLHLDAVTAAVLFAFLVFPTMELVVLLIGIAAAAIWRGVRWRSVLFWAWWPFWKFAFCVGAAALGMMLGGALWQHHFHPAQLLSKMQVYSDISPINATGLRLQDAGLITFAPAVGVDRLMTGCLKDGPTFCIAPILPVVEKDGLRLPVNMSQQDLFMVGMDCCECPGEFRCGDWNTPGTHVGGVLETDQTKQQFYALAAKDFAAHYRKDIKYPIFLEWHNEPAQYVDGRVATGNSNFAVAMVSFPFVLVIGVVVLNGLLQLLMWLQLAGPHRPPTPGDGIVGRLGRKLLPGMYNYQAEDQSATSTDQPAYVQF